MSEPGSLPVGAIGWVDLTVPDAGRVSDFYQQVVGWKAEAVEMEGYDDYAMVIPEGETPVAGICHARNQNSGLPAQWLIYLTVENLDASIGRCLALGGKLLTETREIEGHGKFRVIQDPAGAVAALFEPAK